MKKSALYFVIIIALTCCNLINPRYKMMTDIMLPNINPGDYVKLDKEADSFTYGDIVLYEFGMDDDSQPMTGIYRIVGLPNDSFAIKNNICIINGVENKNRLVRKGNAADQHEEVFPNGVKVSTLFHQLDTVYGTMKAIKIPEGHYFVMGDYRSNSGDSRLHGPAPEGKIWGKVTEIIRN